MPGARLPFHYNPHSQKGGLMYYPLSGVFSGCEVSLNNSGKGYDATTTTETDIAVSGGEIILDSERFTFADFSSLNIETGVDLSAVAHTLDVWLVPTRVTPTLTSGTPNSPSEDDLYIKVVDYDSYQLVEGIYKYDGSSWVLIDDVRKIPYTPGNQNSYSMNQVVPSLTASNFTLSNEKEVFHRTHKPPYLPQPSNVVLRQPGGFKLATISYPGDGTAATITEGIHENDRIRI